MSELFSIYSEIKYLSRDLNFQNDSLNDRYLIFAFKSSYISHFKSVFIKFYHIYLLMEFSVSAHFLFE